MGSVSTSDSLQYEPATISTLSSDNGVESKPGADVGVEQSERALKIFYTIDFVGYDQFGTQDRRKFGSTVPFGPLEIATENVDQQTSLHSTSQGKPPLEVITPIWGLANSGSRIQPISSQGMLSDIKIRGVSKSSMIIRSQALLRALRKCITYYPSQPLTGYEIELKEPYAILIHHLDNIREMQARLKPEVEGHKYLLLLLEYLHDYIEPRISSVMVKLQTPVPSIAFDELWLLFKPGIDVYYPPDISFPEPLKAGVVFKTEIVAPAESKPERSEGTEFRVYMWGMESNGSILGREWWVDFIMYYEGERKVTSLPVFPCRYRDAEDGGKTRQELIDRGRKSYRILHDMPKQMFYDGYDFYLHNQTYRGNCVLDTNTLLSGDDQSLKDWKFLSQELTFQSEHSDMYDTTLSDFVFADFHHLDLAKTTCLPTDRHYFLMPALIPGFALYGNTWRIMNVESLSEIQPTLGMDNLIIDSVNRDIVQAITHAQSHPFTFDQAHNKGEGQVVLLHGSPGVGKTYTVECIAQSTGRPLISLIPGDLMNEERGLDAILSKWFELAEHWKAILLLDEADIFLERRAARDIGRNGVVSIFLRRMEYFRGIFFLTTNRVGQIDDAFLSRVSVVLQYDHLSDDTRKKIWQGFFKKLQKDTEISGGRKIEVDKYAQKFVLNDESVRDLRWNGREIRNALQTAISLASYKGLQEGKKVEETIEVEEDHFRSVVTMSQKFKNYMQNISGKDEDGRARARQDRPDPS